MVETTTEQKEKYRRFKVRYPARVFEDYKKAWQRLERLGQKVNKAWKVKKHSFEIIREERQ